MKKVINLCMGDVWFVHMCFYVEMYVDRKCGLCVCDMFMTCGMHVGVYDG